MPIPDFQTMMLPFLQLASDGEEHSIHEAVDVLAEQFFLTEEEKTRLIPSGQPKFYNRVGWTRTHLKKAGLLDYPKRGYFVITVRGKEVLQSKPERINMGYLRQFPEYSEFRAITHMPYPDNGMQVEDDADKLTPEEALEEAYQKIREDLAFVGALQGQRAKKGIFITTTKFSDEAKRYTANIDIKVVLIDGTRLASLMIDHNVGVSSETTYELKRLDSDYFGELIDHD